MKMNYANQPSYFLMAVFFPLFLRDSVLWRVNAASRLVDVATSSLAVAFRESNPGNFGGGETREPVR